MKRNNMQKHVNAETPSLALTEEYKLHTLANGIRIAHKQVPYTQIAHVGIMLDIGSRDEQPHQQGLAHFWEHMAFKGTEKRSSYHIINRLENVGGELNAYTTKEKICFLIPIPNITALIQHKIGLIRTLFSLILNSEIRE